MASTLPVLSSALSFPIIICAIGGRDDDGDGNLAVG